jgi:hypothetical protein
MIKKYKQFILRLIVLSLVTGLVAYLLDSLLPEGIITTAYPWLIILFIVVTALVHYILLKITEFNPRKFVGYFMLATSFKLLNYLIVIFVYVFMVRTGVLQFVLAFFILYIIYTVFEVVIILSQTKA